MTDITIYAIATILFFVCIAPLIIYIFHSSSAGKADSHKKQQAQNELRPPSSSKNQLVDGIDTVISQETANILNKHYPSAKSSEYLLLWLSFFVVIQHIIDPFLLSDQIIKREIDFFSGSNTSAPGYAEKQKRIANLIADLIDDLTNFFVMFKCDPADLLNNLDDLNLFIDYVSPSSIKLDDNYRNDYISALRKISHTLASVFGS